MNIKISFSPVVPSIITVWSPLKRSQKNVFFCRTGFQEFSNVASVLTGLQ